MFKGAILTFICCILFVTGKPNLIFLEGTKKLVSSIKILKNGTNFTVTCVIEDLKNKRKSLDVIFWINDDLSRQPSETNSITLNKPGTYYCICDKYKLVRRLHLVVRDEPDTVRRKRSQYKFDILRGPRTDIPPMNYPDSVRDFFEGPSKTTSNTNNNNNVDDYIHKYMANSGGGFSDTNNNQNVHKVSQDFGVQFESTNDESHPIYVPQHKDGFNVIYFFAIVLAFVIISLLIYCLSKRRNERVTNARNNENGVGITSNTNNHIEYCSHIFCERYRSTNPDISCYLATLNASGHMPLSTIHHDDSGVTILTSLIPNNDTIDSNSARPYSDSPPAYGISTRNSPLHSTENVPNELDLPPPSYHQAVANMNLGPPPDFDSSVNQMPLSTTSTSLPNVTRTRPPLQRS